MRAEIESPDLPLPVEKLSLNFPNEKNYIQRNYEFFQTGQIGNDKYHMALEILQTHLQTVAHFCLTKPQIDNPKYQIVHDSKGSDIFFLESVIPLINSLLKSQENEKDNIDAKRNLIETKITETGDAISQIVESKELVQCRKNIEEIKQAIQKILKDLKEEDLKLSYEKLLKKKDYVEISVYVNLVGLIMGKESVMPHEVEKSIRAFGTLKEMMSSIILENVSQNQAKQTRISILKIMEQIDSKFCKNVEQVKKYSHLFPFAKWVIAISELILNMFALSSLEVTNRVQTKSRLISYKELLVNEKAFLDDLNKVSEESNSIMNIKNSLTLCLNNSKDVVQKDEILIKDVSTERLYELNNKLSVENTQINEIYVQFQKTKNTSIQTKSVAIYKNAAKYFCSNHLCGYLNCLNKNSR